MEAAAAIEQGTDWQATLEAALQRVAGTVERARGVDLTFLFISAEFESAMPEIVRRVREATGTGVLIGCSGGGVIGQGTEIEGRPAISLMVLSMPGAQLFPVRVTQETLESTQSPEAWQRLAGVGATSLGGWFAFADPYHLDSETFINEFSAAYPTLPLIGGLASSRVQRTQVYLNGDVFNDGAVCVGIGGNYAVEAVVSQGAEPIGEPWTITSADRHMVQTIGQRPALDVLRDTLKGLSPAVQERAQRNLLVGLVMNEYRDEFHRGDFLIRNLIGADPNTGVLAISAHPQVGQTIQFQLRDDRAADDELKEMLVRTREQLGDASPLAAVLCSCNGRGVGLFGQPDHDASMVKEELNLDSVAGFFCNGEIGPVGGKTYLHGFTASIGLIVPRSPKA